jgi:hypothetical protein
MGIIKGKFIVGPVGPVNFRVLNGKNIVSAKVAKGTMKQTKATKSVGTNFGVANRLSSQMMQCLTRPLSGYQDNKMFSRLSTRMNQLLYDARNLTTGGYNLDIDSFSALADFDFNTKSPLKLSLKSAPVISLMNGLLRVQLNDLDNPKKIKHPIHSKSCEIVVSLSLFRLKEALTIPHAEFQRLKLRRDQTAISTHEFNFAVPDGCLCIVAIHMYFYSHTDNYLSILNNKKFSPGSICTAYYIPGEYADTDGRKWFDISRLKVNTF